MMAASADNGFERTYEKIEKHDHGVIPKAKIEVDGRVDSANAGRALVRAMVG